MSRRFAVFSLLGALALFVSSARADIIPPTPTGTVTIDGQSFSVTGFVWNAADDQWELDEQTYTGTGGSVKLGGAFVPDPALVYTFGVTDFGAPSIFTFTTTLAIVPTGSPNMVSASISGGLTDFSGNGVSITPNPANGDPDGDGNIEIQVARVSTPLTNMGVDTGLGASFSGSGAGAVYTYGAYSAGPQFGPSGVWQNIVITTSFQLSGGNDSVSLTGFASIDQIVPEPSSFVLLGVGGMFLAAVGAKRARRRTAR